MQTVVKQEYISGVFLRELKNRFLCEVSIDGVPTVCYVPSSCHLGNFLQLESHPVLLVKNQSGNTRTQYALFALPYKRSYILLSPATANKAIADSLRCRRFSFLGKRANTLSEYTIEGYKADLFIKDSDTVVEIKAVISTDSTAVFPTVYSERTLKQLRMLSARLDAGRRACLLIVSLNPYVKNVLINAQSDFSSLLFECIDKGLIVRAFTCRFEQEKGIYIDSCIPVVFS